MTWTHYLLVFRLESPLHIGWRKTGNLMQTRRYVPGKNLWAALTEALVRRAGPGHDPGAYQAVGAELKRHFRFGYLWPARGEKGDDGSWTAPSAPHFPWSDPTYWDYLYLDGTARTALASERRTAAEGMLHEIEFISPYTREGQPVYLVGDLWVKNELQECVKQAQQTQQTQQACNQDLQLDISNWQEALTSLQIGGERGYGWGRLRLVECKHQPQPQLSWGNRWEWRVEEGQIHLSPPNTGSSEEGSIPLPAHALAVDFTDSQEKTEKAIRAEGPVEPWLGWERGPEGFRLPAARIMYEPGAYLSETSGRFILHPWGYLYATEDTKISIR